MLLKTAFFDTVVVACIIIICVLAYGKKSLTLSGSIAAFLLTLGLYISGGVPFLAALLGFFASSSFFTRLKTREKEELEKALYEKSGTRDHVQVLANGGAAFIAAVVYFLVPDERFTIVYFTALAACNADSWSSEIGILSRSAPFSIISFKPVQKGISGGVTWLGLFSGACGASFIAGIYLVFMFFSIPFLELLKDCVIIAVFGFAGAVLDSIMGAVIQPAYLDSRTGSLTEKRVINGVNNKKVKGLNFFSNDMVNFVSSLLAASLAYFI